jgi:molybdopterin biosynthesis enzyme
MDGFALSAAETIGAPVALRLVGATMAGESPGRALGTGGAARIMTGAPIPLGADAVCVLEATHDDPAGVVIERVIETGANVRRPGEDVAAGSVVFTAGTRLEPAHLGVLASIGADDLTVYRRPVVGVLSTGDELVEPGGVDVGPAGIRDANRIALLGLLAQLGAVGFDLGWSVTTRSRSERSCVVRPSIATCWSRAAGWVQAIGMSSGRRWSSWPGDGGCGRSR